MISRYRRFQGWDYSKGASLFITITTEPRRMVFGRVENGSMVLSDFGRAARDAIEAIPNLNPGISIFGHVVMPDHVHFNVHVAPALDAPLKILGNAIRRFKNHTTKLAKLADRRSAIITAAELGQAYKADGVSRGVNCTAYSGDGRSVIGQLWQQGYHDRLCLTRRFIDSTERYIAYNPLKWELMHGTHRCLRIIEPIDSPRFNADDYWKGVGNVSLLAPEKKMLALRVSRDIRTAAQISHLVKRMGDAVSKGYVIISGFISKGEQAVRDMLCGMHAAQFIRMRPSCIPNARFKPESRYVQAFGEGRYLEIGMGNDEVEFGRGACLDLNAEIIEIATAGAGLAIYWKADGPHVLAGHRLA